MKIILDSNILISALIKDSKTREMIVKTDHDFLMPSIVVDEIRKYKDMIIEKSGMDEKCYDSLLEKLLKYVEQVPQETMNKNLKKAVEIMKDIDRKDAVFIAAALSYPGSRIWSDDRHFERQKEIKILKTKDIMALS